jgi:hypothetical protein
MWLLFSVLISCIALLDDEIASALLIAIKQAFNEIL